MVSSQPSRPTTISWWQPAFARFAATRPGAWLGNYLLHHLDRLVLRLSGGKLSAAQLLSGIPVITLTTTGARSGQARSVPLNEINDGPNLILIASNWGTDPFPAWYHNIRANPLVMVTSGQQIQRFLAQETQGSEQERCWQRANQVYPGYNAYRDRLDRPVPVILLTPVTETKP